MQHVRVTGLWISWLQKTISKLLRQTVNQHSHHSSKESVFCTYD